MLVSAELYPLQALDIDLGEKDFLSTSALDETGSSNLRAL